MITDFMPGDFSDYGELSTISSPYTVKEREDLFRLLPKNVKIKSMIELGCADGNNLIYFKDKLNLKNTDITGLDSCKSKKTTKINEFKFIHQNIEKFLKKSKDKYDLILFSDVLEHIYNPWKILSETKNILNKGGLVLISIPNFQNLNYIISIFNGNFEYQKTGLFDDTHIRFFSKNTIMKYLDENDFKIIDTGWREDQSLKKIKSDIINKLKNNKYAFLEFENIKMKFCSENIEQYFSQQILICAKYE